MARILGKMDYFYFLRHVNETCLEMISGLIRVIRAIFDSVYSA
jgi:hypothetical protein